MKSESLDPRESLEVISQAINQTKENIRAQSAYYLIWGWLVAIAAFTSFIIQNYTEFTKHYYTWHIMVPIGYAITYIYASRTHKKKSYATHLDIFLRNLWMVLGVTFIVGAFISVVSRNDPTTLMLLIAGAGTLISGLSMKFRALIIGGIAFFLFSIGSLLVDSSLLGLLNTFAMIVGYLVPAYILKNTK